MALRKTFRVYKEAEPSAGGLRRAAGSGYAFAFDARVASANDIVLASETITADARTNSGFGDASDVLLYSTFRSALIDRLEVGWFIGSPQSALNDEPDGLQKIVGIEQMDRTAQVWTREVQ